MKSMRVFCLLVCYFTANSAMIAADESDDEQSTSAIIINHMLWGTPKDEQPDVVDVMLKCDGRLPQVVFEILDSSPLSIKGLQSLNCLARVWNDSSLCSIAPQRKNPDAGLLAVEDYCERKLGRTSIKHARILAVRTFSLMINGSLPRYDPKE